MELKEIAYERLQGTDKKTIAKRKIIGSDIKMKQFGLLNMKLAGHDRVREIKIWNRIKSEIRQRNPNMIINDPNSHQENSFALRWAKQMKVGAETNDLDMDLGNGLSFAILMALGMKESKIYEYLAKNETPYYYLNDILKDNDLP